MNVKINRELKDILSIEYKACTRREDSHQRAKNEKRRGRRRRREYRIREGKMVCLACLLPIFLIPLVNALPRLFDFILGKVYQLFGWEYRKPERVPAACPYRSATNKNEQVVDGVNEEKHPEIGKVTSNVNKEE